MPDVVFKNAMVFNAYLKKFLKADMYLKDDKIFYVDYFNNPIKCDKQIDCSNKFITPGFIDIHMHIESSMMSPAKFCDYVAKRGITCIVAEPHEIANVFGVKGILEMIKASKNSPIDVFFGIPSSVPSTSLELEGSGACIDFEAMKELFNEPSAACVGEIMNYSKIIKDDNNLEVSKFLTWLKQNHPKFVIEGHCPRLINEDLAKFLYLGINADHTEHNVLELEQRYLMGMFVQIQEKMLKDDILDFIKTNNLYEHTAFVTDDVMADRLYYDGHLDNVLRKAIQKGFGIENTIYCATYTPALRMQLFDRGAIAPGKKADFIIFDDINTLSIDKVYKDAKEIDGTSSNNYKFPSDFYNSLNVKKLDLDDFIPSCKNLKINPKTTKVEAKILKVNYNTTQIQGFDDVLELNDGILDTKDYMLAACFNRYNAANASYALYTNDCIKEGAIASTWMHDHHNLFVLGKNPNDMLLAAKSLCECGGGMVAVKDSKIIAKLELPVAGIMSEDSVEEVALKLKQLRQAFVDLGYKHNNEIMSFGTLALVCSPFFKLSDKGLVDVSEGKIIKAFKELD